MTPLSLPLRAGGAGAAAVPHALRDLPPGQGPVRPGDDLPPGSHTDLGLDRPFLSPGEYP